MVRVSEIRVSEVFRIRTFLPFIIFLFFFFFFLLLQSLCFL